MDVMHGFHAHVRQCDLFAVSQLDEDFRIAMSGRVDGCPALPDNVTRVQQRRREAGAPRFIQQISLDRRFLDAVAPERVARQVFARRDDRAVSVNPDRPAVEEVLHFAAQRLDQLDRAGLFEADQVHHDVGFEFADVLPEGPGGIFRFAIRLYRFDGFPRRVGDIRFPRPARDVDDFVPALDQHRDQVRADVSTSANDDDFHQSFLLISNLAYLKTG